MLIMFVLGIDLYKVLIVKKKAQLCQEAESAVSDGSFFDLLGKMICLSSCFYSDLGHFVSAVF